MKRITSFIIKLSMLLVAALMMPLGANAKWSKASSDFTYGRVHVKVIDRHKEIGAAYDTYGYTIFTNDDKDHAVEVTWVAYGLLKKGQRLVRLDEGSFTIKAGGERKEVYNYGAGRFTHRDFESYVVAIEAETIKSKDKSESGKSDSGSSSRPKEEKAQPKDRGIDLDDDAILDEILRMKGEGRSFTQDDYSAVISWMTRTFKNQLVPIYNKAKKAYENGDEKAWDRAYDNNTALFDKWSQLGDFIDQADRNGKLDSTNAKNLQKLKDMVEEYDD